MLVASRQGGCPTGLKAVNRGWMMGGGVGVSHTQEGTGEGGLWG